MDRIRLIHEQGRAELRWCTTWNAWAEQLERTWGLPELVRTAPNIPAGGPGDAMKATIAAGVLASGRRLVWADDTAVPSLSANHPAKMASTSALLIAPDGYHGLSPEHMDSIDMFLDAVA